MAAQVSTRLRRATCAVGATVLVAMAVSLSANTPSASAGGGHSYSHGTLWCSGTQIAVGRGMTAWARRRETVRLRHTLYRWNGATWAKVVSAPAVQTSAGRARTVSAEFSYWEPVRGSSPHRPPQFPSWSIYEAGSYAISEAIRWLNSRGAVVDSHKEWLTASAGGGYCVY
jgi:hypothetical protein